MKFRNEIDDPAGDEQDRERLRGMGRWRFILSRGVIGVAVPTFVWMMISRFPEDLREAHRAATLRHESIFAILLHSWLVAFVGFVFAGVLVGWFAWRRLVSNYWPGEQSDSESDVTLLGRL